MQVDGSIITALNKSSRLTLDLQGGAITRFCLEEEGGADQTSGGVNPFNFHSEQRTETGEVFFYQGHFLCLGRWGDPSEGEKKAGIPKHGDFTRIQWECIPEDKDLIRMNAVSEKEGLRIERVLTLAREQPCFKMEETVRNLRPLGRMFNMVQHTTNEGYAGNIITRSPQVVNVHGETIDLRCPENSLGESYDAVFPFIAGPGQQWGWLTAYSPDQGLLLGYVWPREDYHWINLWNHWSDDRLVYRGLEFGTTGIHKPFQEILDKQLTHLLGQRTYGYLDAGRQVTKRYWCFLQYAGPGYKGVENILHKNGTLTIPEKETGNLFSILHDL